MFIMGTGSRGMVKRQDRREIYEALESYVLFLKQSDPDLVLISGMAEGWDEAIAKVGMRNGIPYHVYIPSPSYGHYYWRKNSITGKNRMATFNTLVEHAAEVHVVCANHEYGRANFTRNQVMVDACDSALVYDANSSGTRDAVARLVAANKPYQVYPFPTEQTLF